MEEKKTTRSKKHEGGGILGFFVETFFQSIQSFVDGALGSVQEATRALTRRLARSVLLFFVMLLGCIFLFLGFAKLLSAAYHMPGSGEAIVGGFMLLIALVVYVFNKD